MAKQHHRQGMTINTPFTIWSLGSCFSTTRHNTSQPIYINSYHNGGIMWKMDRSFEKQHAKEEIYHEKQRLQFCLLHALNNLLQGKELFTRTQLDAIANELTLIDPDKGAAWNPLSVVWKQHHNVLTGNYDINVLFAALESKGKKVVWYDRRNSASSMDLNHSLTGIVLNKQVRKLGGLWRSRHWITLRKIDGVWYNLDSDLPAPLAFENGDEELRDYLDQNLAQGGEVLMVSEGSSVSPNAEEQ